MGFAKWLLNKRSKPYIDFINGLIPLFEAMQYEQKKRIADALSRLLADLLEEGEGKGRRRGRLKVNGSPTF